MEKRLVAAILLTVVFLFLYTTLVKPPEESPEEPPIREERPAASAPKAAEEYAAPPSRMAHPDEAGEVVVETDLYRAVFSSAGARLKSFRLKNYAERWQPVDEIESEIAALERRISKNTSEILTLRTRMRSETNGERLSRLEDREADIKGEQEFLQESSQILECLKQQVIDRKQTISGLEEKLALTADPALREGIRNRIAIENGVELIPPEAVCFNSLPPSVKFPSLNVNIDLLDFKSDKEYLRVTDDSRAVRFTAAVNEGAELIKTFTFSNDNYALGLDFTVVNNTGREIREPAMSISYSPGVGLVESAPARGVVTGIVSFIDGIIHTDRIAGRSSITPGAPELRAGVNVWTAIKGKYFVAALIPGFQHCVVSAAVLPSGGRQIEITHPEISIPSGSAFSADIAIYLGPQSKQELSKADPTLQDIIDYGFWSPVAKIIDYLLSAFFRIFNNFGIAIIMLSLTVKIVFYPLTHKSFIAMRKMQDDMKAIQPKINELKKKYGNNQQKLNKAMMELYKKEGVNPMSGCKGGCFPMLLQMPVFFALYAVLNTSIDLRGAHFLGWITDLSMPDPLRILPVLMGVSMFWQQKQTGGGAAAGPQQEQAKMMQWMMPIMLTFIFFGLPAGIVLYWFSFNIFTSLQQMLIKKHGS